MPKHDYSIFKPKPVIDEKDCKHLHWRRYDSISTKFCDQCGQERPTIVVTPSHQR